MFERSDTSESSILEPFFDFFNVVVVALRCGEDIESIIQLHVEGEIRIVSEGEFICETLESYISDELSKEIDEMDDESGDIAELEEHWLWKFLQEVAERLVEVDSTGVVATIIDPDQELSARGKSFWEPEKSLLGLREVM